MAKTNNRPGGGPHLLIFAVDVERVRDAMSSMHSVSVVVRRPGGESRRVYGAQVYGGTADAAADSVLDAFAARLSELLS